MANYAGQHWDTLMTGFLEDFALKEKKDTELTQTFFNLRKVLENSSLYWHAHSFDQYIKMGVAHFGLRPQIFPTIET